MVEEKSYRSKVRVTGISDSKYRISKLVKKIKEKKSVCAKMFSNKSDPPCKKKNVQKCPSCIFDTYPKAIFYISNFSNSCKQFLSPLLLSSNVHFETELNFKRNEISFSMFFVISSSKEKK